MTVQQVKIDCTGITTIRRIWGHLQIPDNTQEWEELDEALCRLHDSRPRMPEITFFFLTVNKRVADDWRSALESRLPAAAKRSLFKVTHNSIDLSPICITRRRRSGGHQLHALIAHPLGKWVVICTENRCEFWDTEFECIRGYTVPRLYSGSTLRAPTLCEPSGRFFAVGAGEAKFTAVVLAKHEAEDLKSWRRDGFNFPGIRSIDLKFKVSTHIVCGSPPGIIMVAADGAIVVEDPQRTSKGYTIDWHCVGRIVVWSLETYFPREVWQFALSTGTRDATGRPTEAIYAATFCPQSTILFGVSFRRRLWTWDVATGLPVRSPVKLPNSDDLDNNSVILSSQRGMRLAWRFKSKSPMAHSLAVYTYGSGRLSESDSRRRPTLILLQGHSRYINAYAFTPDGEHIATAADDATVRLWRTKDGSCVKTSPEHGDAVTHLVISDNGRILASAAKNGTVCIREMRDLLPVQNANGQEKQGEQVEAL
ncbi:quinon protein alcohol dehydrogenase-like superfamily [Daedaleopsis nitida]|nr:quinon protein alcohol dehydrogenase-like superfamily [Daedaleopsis nitida]